MRPRKGREATRMFVTKIQRFSTHDGPGIRTVVFLAGCPLRCVWCHNPEARLYRPVPLYASALCIGCGACAAVCPVGCHTIDEKNGHGFIRDGCRDCLRCTEVCPTGALSSSAEEMDLENVIRTVVRDRAFYAAPDPALSGGLTLSGGEPLAHPKDAVALLRAARAEGISTAIETSGYFDPALLPELLPVTDLFLWDFKDGDDRRHRENTGVSNETSYRNLLEAGRCGARILLRCIIIDGLNTDETHFAGIVEAYHAAPCEEVELLPYHPYGESKYEQLGLPARVDPAYVPSRERLSAIREHLLSCGVRVKPLK